MMARRILNRQSVALVASVALALSACSGDGSSSNDATSPSAPSPATTVAPHEATVSTSSPVDTVVDPIGSADLPPDVGATTRQLDCAEQLPEYVESAIPDGVANPRLTCWAIDVPENYDEPEGRRIDVTYYLWESQTPENDRPVDPIAYAPGGPRGSAFNTLRIFADRDVQGSRDLIMMDTRGNSPVPGDELGIPESGCPELYDSVLAAFAVNEPLDAEYALLTSGWQTCVDRLRAEGWDLDQYNTTNVVNDLEQIRIALGHDQWNFYSESYSTLYALHYMRTHPDSLRAVMLDSVTPPNGGAWSPEAVGAAVDSVFEEMFNGCAESPDCAAASPDLRGAFASAIEQLNAEPHRLVATHPLTGDEVTLSIDGNDLAFGLGELADASTLPALPSIIQAIAGGDRSIIDASAGLLFGIADGGLGLSGATVCHDYGTDPAAVMSGVESAAATADPWKHLGYMSNMPCEIVDVAPAPGGFNDAVAVDVPTLVVIGELDSATPPRDGFTTADSLADVTVASFLYESHVPVRTNDCARAVTVAFWDDLGSVDLACVVDANATPLVFGGAS